MHSPPRQRRPGVCVSQGQTQRAGPVSSRTGWSKAGVLSEGRAAGAAQCVTLAGISLTPGEPVSREQGRPQRGCKSSWSLSTHATGGARSRALSLLCRGLKCVSTESREWTCKHKTRLQQRKDQDVQQQTTQNNTRTWPHMASRRRAHVSHGRTFSWACGPQTGARPALSSPWMRPFPLFGCNCRL